MPKKRKNIHIKKMENAHIKKRKNIHIKKSKNTHIKKRKNIHIKKSKNINIEKENIPSLQLIASQTKNIPKPLIKKLNNEQIQKIPSVEKQNITQKKPENIPLPIIKPLPKPSLEDQKSTTPIANIKNQVQAKASSIPNIEHKEIPAQNQNIEDNEIPAQNIEDNEIPAPVMSQPIIKGTIIERYDIEVDGAKVYVEIRKNNLGIIYNLIMPKISIATESLLNDIRNELISITTITMKELVDPSAFKTIKERFLNDATKLIREKLPTIKQDIEKYLIGKLIQDMLGLGEIEFLVNDPNLEEIVISSAKEPIRVYSKKYGWIESNMKINKEEDIINYSNIIARRVGRQITILNPLLDAHLVTGDRINAVLYPINTKGNTITIRKFARDPFTIIDLINNKTCDLDTAAILWLAIEFEMNILISGGTASGKTSFLNACMPFIPPNQRIISIEDTRELMLPDFLYWSPLVTRSPNPEGKGEVSMLDLLVNSLRMRPDRIILGEMRKQQEAMVLFEAMHTGHSVYATLHADSSSETISRLTNPPLNVPKNLLKAVNLNVVMFRDRRKGIRRILHIAEFEAEADEAKANIIYRWSQEEDKIIKHSESSRFFEEISRNTGMSEKEIDLDLDEKKKILTWLINKNIRDLNNFGRVLNFYYKNKELLIKSINNNDKKTILEE